MGKFGVAAILAALCSSLCLYGSSSSSGDLKYAARIKLDETFGPRTMGSLSRSWLALPSGPSTSGFTQEGSSTSVQ